MRDTIGGILAGSLLTLIPVDFVADWTLGEQAAMRATRVSVRRNIDTAILLAPAVAPSDVALACCVGE